MPHINFEFKTRANNLNSTEKAIFIQPKIQSSRKENATINGAPGRLKLDNKH